MRSESDRSGQNAQVGLAGGLKRTQPRPVAFLGEPLDEARVVVTWSITSGPKETSPDEPEDFVILRPQGLTGSLY